MFCTNCRRECKLVTVDLGIGAYDYAGASRYHRDIRDVSACCAADVAGSVDELED